VFVVVVGDVVVDVVVVSSVDGVDTVVVVSSVANVIVTNNNIIIIITAIKLTPIIFRFFEPRRRSHQVEPVLYRQSYIFNPAPRIFFYKPIHT
jgi:hypothetical protein